MDCGTTGKVGKGRAGGMDKAGDDNGAAGKAPDMAVGKAVAKGKVWKDKDSADRVQSILVLPWLPAHFLI